MMNLTFKRSQALKHSFKLHQMRQDTFNCLFIYVMDEQRMEIYGALCLQQQNTIFVRTEIKLIKLTLSIM